MTDSDATPHRDTFRANAVRYKMLRRLVPSVNHKLAGAMQPITMLASMLARQLQRPQPDIAHLSKQVADMQKACKAAVATRSDVLSWFQPSEMQLAAVGSEVAQCTGLLTAEFAIRGCAVDNLTNDADVVVRQAHVRTMLMAVLFGILDNAQGSVAVQLRAQPGTGSGTTVCASWTQLPPSALSQPGSDSDDYAISWHDVQAIAEQLGIDVQHTPAQIDMHFASAA